MPNNKDLTSSKKLTNSEVKSAIQQEVKGGDRVISQYVSKEEFQAHAENYIRLKGANTEIRAGKPYVIEEGKYIQSVKRVYNPNEYVVLSFEFKNGNKVQTAYLFDSNYIQGLTSGQIKEVMVPARVSNGSNLVHYNVNMAFVDMATIKIIQGDDAFELFKQARLVS